MVNRYRTKIFCFNCDKTYVTNRIGNPVPRKCKLCGSIKIKPLKVWEM